MRPSPSIHRHSLSLLSLSSSSPRLSCRPFAAAAAAAASVATRHTGRDTTAHHLRPLAPLSRPPFSARAMATDASTSPPAPAPPVLKQPVKLACIQLASGADKAANLRHAAEQVAAAAGAGARIVVLPECFNSPYGTGFFHEYAETLLPSPPPADAAPSFHALAAMAADNAVYLIGGSIPERDPAASGKLYNTSLVFGPDGALLDTFRKVHLFDIDIPGKITFRESEVLSAGNRVALVRLPEYGTIAVAICYDVRFPELATIAARNGAFALIYPGAFNLTTGDLHWKLLARARAVDNQIYVAMCSPARDMSATYHAWGHSMIVDPMAGVLAEADEKETIIEAELIGDAITEARKNIPLNTQRRFDVYPDISKGKIQFEEPQP
ncbi:Omega-amidase [Purpureocillium takamizusanense]|uniref:Omega-amidase n=1 Tax=Purpureocillium takamizusanense TaxID=2060973 RepID=A0A9Q8Q9Z6_9HYPO|nr:Omega-amidase [Purpureocillium takamizusanense]UNI15795.1 Omega-amidase [Purpureocillium takamizusanense]